MTREQFENLKEYGDLLAGWKEHRAIRSKVKIPLLKLYNEIIFPQRESGCCDTNWITRLADWYRDYQGDTIIEKIEEPKRRGRKSKKLNS